MGTATSLCTLCTEESTVCHRLGLETSPPALRLDGTAGRGQTAGHPLELGSPGRDGPEGKGQRSAKPSLRAAQASARASERARGSAASVERPGEPCEGGAHGDLAVGARAAWRAGGRGGGGRGGPAAAARRGLRGLCHGLRRGRGPSPPGPASFLEVRAREVLGLVLGQAACALAREALVHRLERLRQVVLGRDRENENVKSSSDESRKHRLRNAGQACLPGRRRARRRWPASRSRAR